MTVVVMVVVVVLESGRLIATQTDWFCATLDH